MFKQQMVSERNMFVFRSRPLNFSVFLCHRHDRVAETDVSRIRLHTPGLCRQFPGEDHIAVVCLTF